MNNVKGDQTEKENTILSQKAEAAEVYEFLYELRLEQLEQM